MTRNEFLKKIRHIRIWEARGQRATNKPLLLLLALGRVLDKKKSRLVGYEEIERPLKDLLGSFGMPRQRVNPHYPFGRLCTDGIWEVLSDRKLSRNASGDLLVGELRDCGARGGFPKVVYNLLRSNTGIVLDAVQELLQRHFPPSLHDEISKAVGITRSWPVRDEPAPSRDSSFRPNVLREYQKRCAVCGFDVRLGDKLIGLEAAHIKWHSHCGPDSVTNGLALCGLHHKALDKGALGIEPADAGFRVVVSSEVTGMSEPVRWFTDYHDKPLRSPLNPELAPAVEFVRWHQRQVFRTPPLP